MSYQVRVLEWLLAAFGPAIAHDKIERNHRFFEEAIELVQAAGITKSECLQLIDYVFNRPVGELNQEVGGVIVTLHALCIAHGVILDDEGDKELRRIWQKIDKIREKHANKPKYSPLPMAEDNELVQLRRWKAEQLEVLNQLQLEQIAKELKIPLGQSIPDKVLPAIRTLNAMNWALANGWSQSNDMWTHKDDPNQNFITTSELINGVYQHHNSK